MTPKGIVLHFTASTYGDRQQIDEWHKANGWSGIGYHYVVMNGIRNNGDTYKPQLDGVLEKGRADNVMGAHCKAEGMNQCTLGISSVGSPNRVPHGATAAPATLTTAAYLTQKQLDTMVTTAAQLCIRFGLEPAGTFSHEGKTHAVITQHSQHDPVNKPLCASLQIANVRQLIAAKVTQLKQHPGPEAEADITTFVAKPEMVEASLPEFTTEVGNTYGPDDLEMDVQPVVEYKM